MEIELLFSTKQGRNTTYCVCKDITTYILNCQEKISIVFLQFYFMFFNKKNNA